MFRARLFCYSCIATFCSLAFFVFTCFVTLVLITVEICNIVENHNKLMYKNKRKTCFTREGGDYIEGGEGALLSFIRTKQNMTREGLLFNAVLSLSLFLSLTN